MATIIGGNGTGTLDSSLYRLTRNDTTGAGTPGHGEQIYINVSDGNLILGHVDEVLPSETNDFLTLRTYNSRGQFTASDGQGWLLTEFSRLAAISSSQIVLLNGDGSSFTFNFDSAANLYRSVDGAGAFETISFNSQAGTYSLVQSNQTVVTYDTTGRLLQSKDTNGNTITYSYDSASNLTSIADNSGHTLQFVYQSGHLASIQDETGVTFASYGYVGNELVSVTDRAGETTTYAYNPDGTMQSVTLPSTSGEPVRTLQFTYSAGPGGPLLASFTDAQGNVTQFGYNFQVDSSGTILSGTTSVTDARGGVTTYTFDGKGQITDVKDRQGFDTVYVYDANKRVISFTDANGSAIVTSDATYFRNLRHDFGIRETGGQGKLVSELTASDIATLQADFTTRMVYDKNGNLTSRTDGAGNVTTYTYTSFNKMASMTSADGNALVTSNDPLYIAKRQELGYIDPTTGTGKKVAKLTAAEKQAILALYTTVYTYDSRENLTQIKAPGGDLTSYTYDSLGNVVQKTVYLDSTNLTDPAKQETTQYLYDPFGNNVKTIDPQGNTTVATFDHFGNRLTQVDGRGGVTTYAYDAENRLTSTTDPLGNTTLNFYDAVGNRIAVQDAAGHTVTYLYSADNLLIGMIDPSADPSQGSTRTRTTTYSYDVVGNRTSTTDAEGRTTTYTYDAMNRLLTVVTPTVTNAAGSQVAYTTTYAYDGVGNRITATDNNGNTTSTIYNVDNLVRRVTDPSGHITDFAYDANLNQVSIVVGSELAVTARHILNFDFDQKNRLISTTDALGNTSRYSYDGADNRRTVTDANGNTTSYTYDLDNRLLIETLPAVADPVTGQPVRYTIQHQYDANGNEITTTDQNGNTVRTSFDRNNRAVLVQDGNGIQTVYTYDSRGNRTSVQIGVQAHLDASGSVVIDSVQGAQVETYQYDEFNEIVATTDGVGNALVTSDSPLYVGMRKQLGIVDPTTGQGKLVSQLTATDIQALQADFTAHFHYDRVGNQTSATDHLGRVTSFSYDGLNRIVQTTDASGKTSASAYDGNGNVVVSTDALGRQVKYSYDALNRVINTTDALGTVTHRVYDKFGNLTTQTISHGTEVRTTRYVYDLNNRLISDTDAQGATRTYQYDAVGNRVQVTDGKGQATRFLYDALNRNITVIDPLGFKTRIVYDGVGNRLSLIDARGGIQQFTYDPGNRQTQIQDAQGRITTYTYDVRGNRVSQTTGAGTPEQETTTYLYDAENHVRQVTDAAGNVSTQDFDAVYNRIRTTDANGHVTSYAYDPLNRQIQVTDATGATTSYTYDAVGNVLSVTDGNGHVTTYAYDARNELILATDANGVHTAYTYDSVGNQLSITHASGTTSAEKITFKYDLDNRLIGQTDALGNTQTHQYDSNGNLTSTTDARGDITTYGYDANNRVTSIVDALGNVTQYRYDGNGNRVQVIDPRGFISTSYYNADNEVALSVDNNGFATSFSYDHNGNIVSQTLFATALTLPVNPAVLPTPTTSAGDSTTLFTYDARNRLVSKTDGEGFVTQYVYDAAGNRTQTRQALDPSATQFEVTRSYYDSANRQIAKLSPQGYLTTYQYDAIGNLTGQIQYNQVVSPPADGSVAQPNSGDSGRTTLYAYDRDNRLASETNPLGVVTTYTYDARGNRISMTEAAGTSAARTTTYAYDAADRYVGTTNALGIATHLDLDANGNVLVRHEAYKTPQERDVTFVYDGNNRVTSETDPLGVVTKTAYDAAGNITSTTLAAGASVSETTTFSYDGDGRQSSVTDATGGVTTYAYDAAGNKTQVGQAAGLPEARTNSFTYNRANRLVTATDALGTVTQYQYDGAGNRITTIQAAGTSQARQTSYAYDLDNRLIQVIDPLGGVTRYQYDAQGNQTQIIDANGGVQVNTFDATGHALTSLTAAGVLTRNTYDLRGNLISATQSFADGSDARTSTYSYDLLNRQVQVTDGESFSTTIVYDSFGNQVSITHGQYLVSPKDPSYSATKAAQAFPETSTFVYDADNHMLSMTDALGNVTSYTYDAIGNRISTTDGNGHTTQYAYDLLNRLIQTTTPEGGITQENYDHIGNRISERQLQSGDAVTGTWRLTTYQYDANGHLTLETGPTGILTSYTYDAMGNTLSKTISGAAPVVAAAVRANVSYGNGPVSETVQMEYDLDNRKIADIDALGNRTTYAYDAVGNRIKVTDALGHVAHYYYDGANQLEEVVDPQGFVNTFSHDAAGNRTRTTVYMTAITGQIDDRIAPTPSSSSLDRISSSQYDRANRLVSSTAPDGSVTQYTYDSVGNKRTETQFANTSAPRALSFAYDTDNRLVTFTDVDGSVTTFTYDKANNKLSQTLTSTTDPNRNRTTVYTYDTNNRELSEAFDPSGLDIVQSFTYDHLGNVLSKTDARGFATTYSYDLNNQMVSQTNLLNETIAYTYDPFGNKTAVTDALGNTTNYVYDLNNRLVQEIKPPVQVFDSSTGFSFIRPVTTHIYDAVGNEVQTIDASNNPTTRYFDGDGRMVAQIDAANALTAYTYDAAGDRTSQTLYMTFLDATAQNPATLPPPPTGDSRLTTYAYDLMSRLTLTTYPPAQISSLINTNTASPGTVTVTQQVTERNVYDSFGNLIASFDKNGNRTLNYYDVKGRKTGTVDPAGYLTQWDYDQQGNILEQRVYAQALDPSTLTPGVPPTPPSGAVFVTDRQYDAASRLVKETDPQISVFDPNTQTSSLVRPTTTYTYDPAGNQITRTLGAGTAQAVTEYRYYDSDNRLVAVINGNRVLSTYAYDKNGNEVAQKRYFNPVPASVDVTQLTGSGTNFQTLVASDGVHDEETDFSFDGMNRMIQQTDVFDFGYGHLTKQYEYDAVSNKTFTQDEDGFITKASYDGLGRIVTSTSPDGTGTRYEYDAAGNRVLIFTGVLSSGPPSPATNIAVSLGSNVAISWNTQGSAQQPQQTWIVYDTVSHQNLGDYANRTAAQVSGNGLGQASVTPPATGSTLFFRVVTQDGAGNETWSDEQSIVVPPRFSAVSVAQPDANTIVVTAHFDAGAANPVLAYGTSGALNQSTPFVLQSDGSYQATLSGVSNPESLSFALQWQDAGANSYSSAVGTFTALADQVAVTSAVSQNQIVNGSSTAYTISVSSRIASAYAGSLTAVQAQWRIAGSGAPFAATAVTGTDSGQGYTVFNATLGDINNLAPGTYEIVLTGVRADGTSVELDHFNFVVGSSATTVTRGSVTWAAPTVGDDQLAIIGGQNSPSTRDGGRIVITDGSATPNAAYTAFYGQDFTDTHTVTVNSTPHTENNVVTGNDIAVQADLTAAEAANISGSLHLAWRPADSGTAFSNDVLLTSSGSNTFATTLGNLAAGQYDLKLYYVDAQGNQVIVEWQRIDAATVNNAFTGHSLTVLAQEDGGTINTDANGVLTVAPGIFTGQLNAAALSASLPLQITDTGNAGGSLQTDGRSTGYFTEIQYNALNYRIASNENDGLWRQYNVDGNGNVLETDLLGDRSNPNYNPANFIATFAAYDARNRKVADFGAPVTVAGSTAAVIPVTRYTYNVLDKVTQQTDPLGKTTQYVYNALGTLTQQTDALGATTQTLVDQFGNVTAEVTPLANRTLKFYDLQNRLIKEIDPVGNTTSYSYDVFDRKISQTDGLGNTTTYAYDFRDRLVSQTDALGNTTTYIYDGRNQRISTLYPQNERTDQVYDGLGRVIDTIVYLNGQPTHSSSAYDAYGNLISETDQMSRTKTHVYGAFGRLLEDIDEDGNVVAYAYDVYGRRTNSFDPNLVSDPNAATDSSGGKDIQTSYDQGGRITSIRDLATGVSTTYGYDLMGRRTSDVVTTPSDAHDRNESYQYDALGQLVRWQDTVTGDNLNRQYDAEGNIVREYTDTGYDPLGQNTSGNPNFRYIDHVYTYDQDRRVSQEVQRTTDASGNISNAILNAYTYDAASNRHTWNNQGVIVTYQYDADNHVSKADFLTGSDSNEQVWTYDKMGNVLSYTTSKNGSQTSSTVNTYNDANRETSSNKDGQVTTEAYDNSLRITQTIIKNKGKTFYYNYTYFGDGREKSIHAFGDANGNSTSTYDANKIRIRVDLGQGDSQTRPEYKTFLADNEGHIIFEFHDDGKSSQNETDDFLYANGNPIGQNIHGTDGKLTVQLDSNSYAPIQNLSDSNPGSNLTYIVQNGDSLQTIASQMYGNASLWFVIAEANGLGAGDALKAGTQLLIPNTIKSGTITADTHKVYSESEVVGSTLPNLKSPPPHHQGGCAAILSIIIVVVIAVVASFLVPGLGEVLVTAFGIGSGTTTATIATVATYALAGAIVGAIGSVIQQGLFLALGYQQKFSWKEVAGAAVGGALGGAASEVGTLAKTAVKAGKLFAKIAEAALDVSKAATQQLIDNGKITSWTGLASAAAGGYLGGTQLSRVLQYATPWVELAESYARTGKVTPSDWINAVGSTLSQAVSDISEKYGVAQGDDPTQRLESAGLAIASSGLVAGAFSLYDKKAAADYIYNGVGQEVGQFIGQEATDFIQYERNRYGAATQELGKQPSGSGATSSSANDTVRPIVLKPSTIDPNNGVSVDGYGDPTGPIDPPEVQYAPQPVPDFLLAMPEPPRPLYQTQSGDSYAGLADKIYGDERYFPLIMAANNIDITYANIHGLQAERDLIIPDISNLSADSQASLLHSGGILLAGDQARTDQLAAQQAQTAAAAAQSPATPGFSQVSPYNGQDALVMGASIAGLPGVAQLINSLRDSNFMLNNDEQLFSSSGERLDRVTGLLQNRTNLLLSTGEKYGVDPRAIAAAISWEYSQNPWGYGDDFVPTTQPFGGRYANNGFGWGEMHASTLIGELRPGTSLSDANQMRNDLDTMIDLVGARIKQQSDTYFTATSSLSADGNGIDLRSNPVASTWLYNTSAKSLEDSAGSHDAELATGAVPTLQIQNDMANWTQQNLSRFSFATPLTALPNTGLIYNYTVKKEH